MSEELLKAIIQLFAIVARERITEDERANIKEFLSVHLNRDATNFYLKLFDELSAAHPHYQEDSSTIDAETQQFVEDWANIMKIVKQVNQALTVQQKLVLIIKIIELVYLDRDISDRQANLVFYIGQALKIPQAHIDALQQFVVGQDIDELGSKHVLIIDEGSGEYPSHRIIEKDLTGLIAILRLPDTDIFFIKYLGITTLYLNSILLKSRSIHIFPTGSTIRGDKVGPVYYSDIIGKFLSDETDVKITFTADHVFYHFTSGRAGIQNVNIAEEGGKLIGLMGASGSGKSTLLNVLNGTEKPSSGRVIINGVDIYEDPTKIQGVIGYVPQDDLLIEELTVYENLYYASKLCFGHYTEEQIEELINTTLINLGLTEIKELKVGNPLNKTISGGQRKRLNIGLELLREPTVLFVDEPTSGLSSRDSENIMDLLKELSLRGKMVFVVIHQPSSDIFKMFDTLIILDVGGFQIYYGNPIEAVSYFRDIVNAANKNQGACPECGNINPEQIFSIIETKVVNEYGRLTNTRKVSAGQWYQYFKQKVKIPKIEHIKESISSEQRIPSWWQQFRLFISRDIVSKLSNKQYFYINLLQAPVLAFFIAYMVKYYNVLDGDAMYSFHKNVNIPVYFFMSVVVALFFGLTMSAEEIFRDRKMLKRERFLNLSRGSYLVSKVSVMFLISSIQTLLFTCIGNWVLEIPVTEIRYWVILFTCSCFANLIGLNISSAFNSAVTIYILIPVIVIPQLLMSGVVITFDRFNPKVGKPVGIPLIGETMASRWAFEAYMVTQFKDNPYERLIFDFDKIIAKSDYKRIYFFPMIESKLTYCLHERKHWRDFTHEEIASSLALVKKELLKEVEDSSIDKFKALQRLDVGKFDSTVYQQTLDFINVIKEAYSRRADKARLEKETLIASLTNSPSAADAFAAMKERYVNRAVSEIVKNVNASDRIVAYEGNLVQLIYPIYQEDHQPKSLFDFRAKLYQPTKQFLGYTWDTLWFNLGVIWLMTLILFVALYYDILYKIVHTLENRLKYRRKDKH
jgi:ABC-type multidrug transport system ATPase subunit